MGKSGAGGCTVSSYMGSTARRDASAVPGATRLFSNCSMGGSDTWAGSLCVPMCERAKACIRVMRTRMHVPELPHGVELPAIGPRHALADRMPPEKTLPIFFYRPEKLAWMVGGKHGPESIWQARTQGEMGR